MKNRYYILNEQDITKAEVERLARNEVEKMLKSRDMQKRVKEICADVVENFYRILWQRKDFWKGSLKENEEKKPKVTFYKFYNELRDSMQGMLKNTSSDFLGSEFWKENNITKHQLLKLLVKHGIVDTKVELTKDAKINGKYTIKSENFKSNIKKLYNELFNNNEEEPIEETTCAASSGAFVAPMTAEPIRRK